MSRLEGKRIAITGAAGGLGQPVVARLRDEGAHVTGIGRAACGQCDDFVMSDLGQPDQLAALAQRLTGDPPDVLVNIAGVLPFGLHETLSAEEIARCYHLNLVVPSVLASAVAAPMRSRGSGQIVNIGSMLGAIPYPWFAAYSSSKAGLAAFSQALGRELSGSGVAVTHISPRAARTPMNSGEVNRFLDLMGMKTDEPDWVADRIVAAIIARRQSVRIGAMERVYAAMNSLAPRMIDNGLASQIRRARAEFS